MPMIKLIKYFQTIKSQFSNFTGQYAFTLQLNGDFPEHEKIRDSSLDFL
jgi:hypothetical protein